MSSQLTAGAYLNQLWQNAQPLQERLARTQEAFNQAIQESQTAQAIQESTTRVCNVCQQRVFRGNAFSCNDCKKHCCKKCVVAVHLFNPAGMANLAEPGRKIEVCKSCRHSAQARCRKENVIARMQRLHAFLEDRLEPYKYSAESKVDKSFRLGVNVMSGVKTVAGFLPVAGEAVAAINAGYYIIRYGPLVLAGDDIAMALQLLVNLATKLDAPALVRASPQDLWGGLYYMMGETSGERGKTPELEYMEHLESSGLVRAPERARLLQLRSLVRIMYVATYSSPTPTDAQRVFKQVLPGSELLLVEISIVREIPSYFVVCTKRDKRALLILPGTSNVADIVTDVNAESEALLCGCAHKGMVQSARWLLGEVAPVLKELYTKGYHIEVVGHSLGAGVGALLTVMLRREISNLVCYGFGTPSCVDDQLMVSTLDCVVSVVNRDDIVPRLSVQNVQQLAESALCPGQIAKTKAWMAEDWKAIKDVERIIELRQRESPAVDDHGTQTAEKIKRLCEAGVSREAAERALLAEKGDLTRALLRATEEEVQSTSHPASEVAPANTTDRRDCQAQAHGIQDKFLGQIQRLGSVAAETVQSWSAAGEGGSASTDGSRTGPSKYPRFFVPGQVVHLYRQNGLGRAALANCTHDTLVRISPCQNMLDDHLVKSYDEVLRQACIDQPNAPTWQSFDAWPRCACCDADFNWAYVLRSEPQRMLARHHCCACGKVVCDGCSQNRQAHPQLGFASLVRTCDACFFRPSSG